MFIILSQVQYSGKIALFNVIFTQTEKIVRMCASNITLYYLICFSHLHFLAGMTICQFHFKISSFTIPSWIGLQLNVLTRHRRLLYIGLIRPIKVLNNLKILTEL